MIAAITPCGLIAAAGSGGGSAQHGAESARVEIADVAATGTGVPARVRPPVAAAAPALPTPPPPPAPAMPGLAEPPLLAAPTPVGLRAIPVLAMAAYQSAADRENAASPNCHITPALLAAIGKVESDHGNGGRFDLHGNTLTPILGPVLDGHLPGNEVIKDPHGNFERAVGPMQFMPATWAKYGADGNGDGKVDPNNIFDASYGAARLLCASGKNLAMPSEEFAAILSYNHSAAYAQTVLAWATAYALGVDAMPMPSLPSLVGSSDYPTGSFEPVSDQPVAAPAPEPPPAEALPAPAPAAPAPGLPTLPTVPGAPLGFGSATLPPLPCLIFCPPPATSAPVIPQLPTITLPPLPCLIFCPPPAKPTDGAKATEGAKPEAPGQKTPEDKAPDTKAPAPAPTAPVPTADKPAEPPRG